MTSALVSKRPSEGGEETLQTRAARAREPVTVGLQKLRMAVLADSSIQWLSIGLRGYARIFGFDLELVPTTSYQVAAEIYNPQASVYRESPKYVVVYESSRALLERFRSLSLSQRSDFARETIEQTRAQLKFLKQSSTACVLWFEPEDASDGVFGGFSARHKHSFEYQLKQYAALLWSLGSEQESFFVVPFGRLIARGGSRQLMDSRLFCMSQATIGLDAVPVVARQILQMVSALEGRLSKCLVLDLDNTLWGGVVGDVGVEGIELGDLGLGRAYQAVQEWALELKKRGIFLAVASKNSEESARGPFLHHREMLLKLEDFACFEANWGTKAESVQRIREFLNIGFDSMVFIDDNPMERDLVRQFLPEVLVPELPEDPSAYVEFLCSLDLFGAPQVTSEDGERTSMMQAERARHEVQAQFASLEDYLLSLKMEAEIFPLSSTNVKRVAQLLGKSNQFNLRTVRKSEGVLEVGLAARNHRVLCCSLRDRFGDYGLISVIELEIHDSFAFIENWVMSCRVFNRGVEDLIAAHCVELCKALALDYLVGEYLPTSKNSVVADLYPRLGFEEHEGRWRLRVENHVPAKASYVSAGHRRTGRGSSRYQR